MGDVWVVTALDEHAGEHIVGVFDDEGDAEYAACAVPNPWAAMVDRRELNVAYELPGLVPSDG